MTENKRKWLSCLLGAAILLLMAPSLCVRATGIVGMSSPDDVSRGSVFKLQITATGAAAGVDGVQLYLEYNAAAFQFVKANSILLETPGSQISEGTEAKPRTMNDSGSMITLLAYMQPGNTGSQLVAELEFLCRVDAPIGPASFHFTGNSFVSVVGVGKVMATDEKLSMAIVELNVPAGEQPNPYPPVVTDATAYIGEPGMPPPNSNDLVAPAGEVPADPNALGVNAQNAETAAPASPSRPAAPIVTARPDDTQTSATTAATSESPLRAEDGQALYLVEEGLAVDAIPSGFQGDSMNIHGINIPTARSATKGLTLYWLKTAGGPPAFYSYDINQERFKLFNLSELKEESQTASQTAREFRTGEGSRNTWLILLVSLLGLSSLSVLIYTLSRNLRS